MKDFDPDRRARLDSVDFGDFWTLPFLEINKIWTLRFLEINEIKKNENLQK